MQFVNILCNITMWHVTKSSVALTMPLCTTIENVVNS